MSKQPDLYNGAEGVLLVNENGHLRFEGPGPLPHWVCKCGEEATLHRTINGFHEYLCNECIDKEERG